MVSLHYIKRPCLAEVSSQEQGLLCKHNESIELRQAWWCTPLILVVRRLKQEELPELEDSLVYMESSRSVKVT